MELVKWCLLKGLVFGGSPDSIKQWKAQRKAYRNCPCSNNLHGALQNSVNFVTAIHVCLNS